MPAKPLDDGLLFQALEAFRSAGGNKAWAAARLGLPVATFNHRLSRALESFPGLGMASSGTRIKQRIRTEIKNGVAFAFSDAHFHPSGPSVAHGAFLRLANKLKPVAMFDVGDSLDGASISRHPMTGNDDLPSVQDELFAVLLQRGEMMQACEKARLYWCYGNHCSRFDKYLATNAPRLSGVKGLTLADNLPGWNIAWAIEINWDSDPILITHNWKGGAHASHNNSKDTAVHFVSGHDHRLGLSRYTNERGILYGINPGVFADVNSPAFRYTQGRPKDWRSGFVVLTFRDGLLLPPEHCEVVRGAAYFRGEPV